MTDTSVDDGQLYINGKFTKASGGRRFEVTDPSTGAVVGTVADADPADVDVAVTAARGAFHEGPWPKMSGRERARILHKAADLVRASAGLRTWPILRQGEADLVAQVRQALGADRFDQVFATGARLTQRDAVAAARAGTAPAPR
jgi:delta 1-pyrroline-5-carboxylate dehydrogenase